MDKQYNRRIYVPVKIMDGQYLPNDVIVIYSVLNELSGAKDPTDTYYMSVKELARLVYKVPNPSPRQRKKIAEGIEKINYFIPNAVQPSVEDCSVFEVFVQRFIERDYNKYRYGFCYSRDLNKVLKLPNSNVFTITAFYLKFLATFDSNKNVGHISSAYVAGILGLTEQTVKNHVKTLLDCNALMRLKTPSKKLNNHSYYKYPDIYYRPYDESLAIEYKENCNEAYYHKIEHSQPD